MQSLKYEIRYDQRSRLEEEYGRLWYIYMGGRPLWTPTVADFFTAEVGEQTWNRMNEHTWREALDALG